MSYPDGKMAEKLTIAFDGEALKDGTIDVRDLAPALLALGDLFKAANQTLNDDRAEVSVRIRATRDGSFELGLDVVVSLARQVAAFFAGPEVSGAINLITVLGFGAFAVKNARDGVIQVMKRLRGRKPEQVIENIDGTVTLVVEREQIIVTREVVRVIENAAARDAVRNFVAPLRRDGIDTIEVRSPDMSGEREVLVTKEELPALQAEFAPTETPEPMTLTSEHKAVLKVASVNFQDGKWKFSEGEQTFWATVDDGAFQVRVDRGESFAKYDSLVCTVRRTQTQGADGKMTTEYAITRVEQHRKAAQQQELQLLPVKEEPKLLPPPSERNDE